MWPGLSRTLLEGGLAVGRALSGTRGPAGLWRTPRLRKLFDSGASLRLQFPKEDLGFAYTRPQAAVVSRAAVQQLLRGQGWQVRCLAGPVVLLKDFELVVGG